MYPERLRAELRAGLAALGITYAEIAETVEIKVERPLRSEHGDFSSPVALRVAGPDGPAARELAERLADRLRRTDGIADVTIAGAGHLNVRLAAEALASTVRELAEVRTEKSRTADEASVELRRLIRGADALGVRDDAVDLDDIARPTSRHLICLLAETADLIDRRPDRLPRHVEEIVAAWRRVEAVQPILPMGDEQPTARHGAGRLLAAATSATYDTLAVHDAL